MDFRVKQIAPPREWTVFEDLCLAIFRAEWNDALALKNGRVGQPQHGVDVYGSPQAHRNIFYGVQCKGKERNYGSKATVSELKKELAQAEHFRPSLSHWIFATTASKDATLQQTARELSAERHAIDQFPVTALGWEDIQSLLARHPDVVEDFYPEHAYDIAGVLNALRALPSGEEVRDLRNQLKRLNEISGPRFAQRDDAQWDPVSFAGERDLGPALLGRGLGPADATACPRLHEADVIVAQLRRGFSARLLGSPGSGKSVCAYQAAADFAAEGWSVRRIRDAGVVGDLAALPPDDLCLLLLDDAHLMPRPVLQQIEEAASTRRFVLSVHNDIQDGPINRGAIVLDAKQAVRTIAMELLAQPERTLAAVRRADDDVGTDFLDVPLEQRIDDAVSHSDRPWQFCFVLGGGWKRAKEVANAAHVSGADLVLAAASIVQLASRDAPLAPTRLREYCEQCEVAPDKASRAISWLVWQRLLLSETDCRCPHQRFALVVLHEILKKQDEEGRAIIGRMLTAAVRDNRFPIAGLRVLLHELRFLGDYGRWTGLVEAAGLEPLIARCLGAVSADERTFAALLFSDLETYVDRWFERIRRDHVPTIAEWINTATPPAAYGLRYLLNALRNDRDTDGQSTALEIVRAVDPQIVGEVLSAVTPESAGHSAELIRTIGWERPDGWKDSFDRAFDRNACIKLARTWPSTAPLYDFAQFCSAVNGWDDNLGLEMTEAFIPTAQSALEDGPVSAFRKMEDIFDHVLRLSDPLRVYVGKLAPDRRRLALGKAACTTLKSSILAAQLSETARREFQDATFFLAFLRKASNAKFRRTVEEIDWGRIADTIGDGWANLSHQDQIFLTIGYSSERARARVSEVVTQKLDLIEGFPPRLATMMPEVRLSQHDHFEFEFGAILIAQMAQLRPELVEAMLSPFEIMAGAALSKPNASWFRRAALFVEVLKEAAPATLDRILSTVDVTKAEPGWADCLATGRDAQITVSLLVESALSRDDAVGHLARRLRKQYPSRSVPTKRNRHNKIGR
jgi:hypothetical protein